MLGFSPFKRHARGFEYRPIYYDPAKEARDERRRQLHGEPVDEGTPYEPGQYLRRRQWSGRRQSLRAERGGRRNRWLAVIVPLVLLLLLVILLYKCA